MKFAYIQYEVLTRDPSDVTDIYRPVIPMHLHGPAGTTTLYGLLDTGADTTVLPATIASAIGIGDRPQGYTTLQSPGGQHLIASYHEVTLEVRAFREAYRWSATVGLVRGDIMPLLGRAGFLDYFRTTFDGERHQVTLKPIADFPGLVE